MFNKKIQKSSSIFELPKNRKAQGISINTIIIAAIALLVLVILSVLLIRGAPIIECSDAGGTCASSCADFEGTYVGYKSGTCSDESMVCCVPIKDSR